MELEASNRADLGHRLAAQLRGDGSREGALRAQRRQLQVGSVQVKHPFTSAYLPIEADHAENSCLYIAQAKTNGWFGLLA